MTYLSATSISKLFEVVLSFGYEKLDFSVLPSFSSCGLSVFNKWPYIKKL